MTDKDGGMMTRARRQRSQSREINGNPGTATSRNTARNFSLEAVAEIPSTPINASQKSARTESSMSLGMNGSSQSAGGSRANSPISFSRAQEKEELQNLNDRLAKILNKLNESEEENKILKVQLKTVQQDTAADLGDQIDKYREELGRARTAIDTITHDKDREIIAKDKAIGESRDSKSQLEKAKARVEEAENRVKAAEKLARDKEVKLAEVKAALSESDANRQRLEKELDEIRRRLQEATIQIEQEVLLRSGLENALKTAEEKAKFESNLLESKLQRQSLSVTTVDYSNRSQRRSGADFSDSVLQLRGALDEARDEIELNLERMYAQKIDDLEALCDSQQESLRGMQQALDASRNDHKEVQKDNQQLRNKVNKLEKELEQQSQKFDQHKLDSTTRIGTLTEQANQASQQYQELLEEFRDVQNVNVEMTTELSMYNSLLVSEEQRLGIVSSPESLRLNGSGYGASGRKRKRVESAYSTPSGLLKTAGGRAAGPGASTVKSQIVRTTVKTSENTSKASGAVRILEVVPGKVIRIENTGDAIVQLTKWAIKQRGASGEATFAFGKEQMISGHSIISVYSATETAVPHDGVTEILATSAWIADGQLETVLSDGEGKEMANHQVSADSAMEVESPSSARTDSPRTGMGLIGRLFGR